MINSRRRPLLTLVALAALGATVALHAQPEPASRSFLWRATKGQGVVYLVGSMHMLTKDYYPLSRSIEDAFAESDLLVEEVDLGILLEPQSQLQLLNRSLLPGNQQLDELVSKETFALVSERVAALGLPLDPLRRFKAWGLAVMLLGIEWQRAGFDQSLGLDQHFYDRARGTGKAIQGLESVEFQISRFDELSREEQDRLLAQTIHELDTQLGAVTALADAWKVGDVSTVEQFVLRDLKEDPRLYDILLLERNQAWLPQIESLFARPRPAFVVVGAAHLVGQDGLIAMLRSRGYSVEQQ